MYKLMIVELHACRETFVSCNNEDIRCRCQLTKLRIFAESRIPLSNFGGNSLNALIKEDRQRNLLILPATPLSGRLCERTHMRVLFTRAISDDKMLIGFKRNHQKIAPLSMYRTAFYRNGDPVKGIIRKKGKAISDNRPWRPIGL
jgi:hypothetical protein